MSEMETSEPPVSPTPPGPPPGYAPPVYGPSGAPYVAPGGPPPGAPRVKTQWRDVLFGWRSAVALFVAGIVLGGLGGAAITVVVDHHDSNGRPGVGRFPGGFGTPRSFNGGLPGTPGAQGAQGGQGTQGGAEGQSDGSGGTSGFLGGEAG